MSNPSESRHDAEDANEYDEEHEYDHEEEEEEEDFSEDLGDDLHEMPELRSCLGALVAAIAFWLGLALTALCFCAVFAVALRCI